MCNYLSGLLIPTDQGMIVRTCKNMTHHEDCYRENKITPEMVSYEFEWTSEEKSSLEIRFPDEMSANRQRQIKKWLTDQYKTRSKLGCYLLSTLDFSKDDSVDLRSLTAVPDGFSLPSAKTVDLSSLTAVPDGFSLPSAEYVDLRSLTAVPDGFSLPSAKTVYLRSGRKYL